MTTTQASGEWQQSNTVTFWQGNGTSTPVGGSFAPVTSGLLGSGSTMPLLAQPTPCESGHHLGEDLIEHIDGVIVGYCTACNVRVVLDKIPGGVSLLRCKALLAGLMSLGSEQEVVDESELLGLLASLQSELNVDEYALDEARDLLDLAKKVINKRIERAA